MTMVPEDKTKRKLTFQGLRIDVQFDKGDRRHYPAANGYPEYNVVMAAIYGEVPKTKGTDGDPVDVYIGPEKGSEKVFIIRQMKFPKYESFDEEKCMLGFSSAEEAKTCYLKHHKSKKIFGGIKELSMTDFKKRLETKGVEGKKLAARAERAVKKLLGTANTSINEVPQGSTLFNDALHGASKEASELPTQQERLKRLEARRGEPVKKLPENWKEQVETLAAELKKKADLESAERAFAAIFDKTATKARVDRIADRVDDVGIGMLAAPYAAKAVSKTLAHRGGRLGALGAAAGRAADAMHHHENKLELGGLALVAPGITHRVAHGLDKALPGQKKVAKATQLPDQDVKDTESVPKRKLKEKRAELERFAMAVNPDFEDMTEPEKLAFLGTLTAMAGKALPRMASTASTAVQGASKALGAGATAVRAPVARMAAAVKPGFATKAMAAGAAGLGAYGAYKGIQAAGNMLSNEHEHPIAPPSYVGPRLF